MSEAVYNHLIQTDDDRRFRDFAGGRTGHDPKWDAVVVGRVRSRAGAGVCVTGVRTCLGKSARGARLYCIQCHDIVLTLV